MNTGLLVSSISRRAGGILHSSRRLAQEMQVAEGVNAEVFSLRDEYSAEFLNVWEPLAVHLFDIVGPRSFGYAPGFSGYLKSRGVDLVHLHGIWMYPSVVGLRWARSSGQPLVVSSHGMLDSWALRQSRLKKRIARLLYEDKNLRSAGCIHSLCPAETQAIRRLGFQNPICEIPNGVDTPAPGATAKAVSNNCVSGPSRQDACGPSAGRRPVLPGKGALAATGNLLLYVGRLHAKKQLPSLLRGWKRLEESSGPGLRDWRLAIVGWDESNYRHELQTLIADLALRRVHLSGPVFGEDLTSLFFSAAAVILPSVSEGMPMVVLEAWAHGLPVIMTDQCNLPGGFAEGAAIRTSPDPDSISRAMFELIRMSDRDRTEMGRRGLNLVKKRYVWSEIAWQMARVYEWLLGGGPAPQAVVG